MTIKELEQCISDYGKDIYSFCKYLTKNSADADDLYQDTFLLAMEQVERLNEKDNVKGYLLSAAVKIWHNKIRKKAWRSRITGGYLLELEKQEIVAVDVGQTAEEVYLAAEQRRKIRKEIENLPDHYRIVVLLYYMQGLGIDEIGRLLSIPAGTVKSRLHQARKKLRRKLVKEKGQFRI
ncbi:MAG: RNA polymerase sigma factor [Lachnospiraceae bacterium]|nr:RNA polymerase sigma factor [Lachnospiraceae bacterium]